jgi:uncharacterized protein (DUF427 family)
MTVRATWNSAVLAESNRTILVDGNHYFPPEDVAGQYLQDSSTPTHCGWKGDAGYYDVVVDGARNGDAAWYYTDPYEAAKEIAGYVAFWHGVHVSGSNPGILEIQPPRRS